MALKSVRDTAYQTLYFADKMLSDYESLEDARAVSQLMSDALSEQLDTARKQVGAAYESQRSTSNRRRHRKIAASWPTTRWRGRFGAERRQRVRLERGKAS